MKRNFIANIISTRNRATAFCHTCRASESAGHDFRVLITREELPSVREDFRDSKERLIELLGTRILSGKARLKDNGSRMSANRQ